MNGKYGSACPMDGRLRSQACPACPMQRALRRWTCPALLMQRALHLQTCPARLMQRALRRWTCLACSMQRASRRPVPSGWCHCGFHVWAPSMACPSGWRARLPAVGKDEKVSSNGPFTQGWLGELRLVLSASGFFVEILLIGFQHFRPRLPGGASGIHA